MYTWTRVIIDSTVTHVHVYICFEQCGRSTNEVIVCSTCFHHMCSVNLQYFPTSNLSPCPTFRPQLVNHSTSNSTTKHLWGEKRSHVVPLRGVDRGKPVKTGLVRWKHYKRTILRSTKNEHTHIFNCGNLPHSIGRLNAAIKSKQRPQIHKISTLWGRKHKSEGLRGRSNGYYAIWLYIIEEERRHLI